MRDNIAVVLMEGTAGNGFPRRTTLVAVEPEKRNKKNYYIKPRKVPVNHHEHTRMSE